MRVGPFRLVKEEGDKVVLEADAVYPDGIGRYRETTVAVEVPRASVTKQGDAYYVDTDDQFLIALGAGGRVVVPHVDGNKVVVVVPVLTVSDDGARHTFYGFAVEADVGSNRLTGIKGIGLFERASLGNEKRDVEAALPARLVRDVTEFTDDDYRTVTIALLTYEYARLNSVNYSDKAKYVAKLGDLLMMLVRSGARNLAERVVAEAIRTDPLLLAEVGPDVIREVLSEGSEEVKKALAELAPESRDLALEVMFSDGRFPAWLAKAEEERRKREEEEKKRKEEEERRRREEEERRRREEEQRRRDGRKYRILSDLLALIPVGAAALAAGAIAEAKKRDEREEQGNPA